VTSGSIPGSYRPLVPHGDCNYGFTQNQIFVVKTTDTQQSGTGMPNRMNNRISSGSHYTQGTVPISKRSISSAASSFMQKPGRDVEVRAGSPSMRSDAHSFKLRHIHDTAESRLTTSVNQELLDSHEDYDDDALLLSGRPKKKKSLMSLNSATSSFNLTRN